MKRKQVYKDMKKTFGLVPSFMKSLPDNSLEMEWELFKRVQMEEGPIPNKYRELIGLAIAAITKCSYCRFYHTELAKLNGATEAEIEDAVHYAKCSAGWSAYITGMSTDYEQFKKEVRSACEHVKKQNRKSKKK